MAEVYRARAGPATTRSAGEPDEVVLKRLLPAHRADGAHVRAFVEEAKLAVRLRHPHIVRTWRLFKAGPDYLMVQELVGGPTLGQVMERLARAGAPVPPAAACHVVAGVLRALDYLHRARVGEEAAPIVHRDVNPANVLLSPAGEVKLTDFGVAEVEGSPRGEPGALRGTLGYMSPEQVLGAGMDARGDLYAVGVVLWELLAGRRLYGDGSEAELRHRVRDARAPLLSGLGVALPEYASHVVRRALFADRERRFQTAAEFLRALDALVRRAGWGAGAEALRPLVAG
jgi:serine/threonine-protein kinase